MATRSESLDNQGVLQDLSGNRKRALGDEVAEGEVQSNKKRHTVPENTNIRDDDDISLDSDMERLFTETDDEEDTEVVDDEPEQGPVLWSEDQEGYPPCAIYHEDVKQHQARIVEFAFNIANQLSRISHKVGDMAKLYAEAIACQRFPEPKKIVIALVGDAGSGKRSLINSLLDIPHVSQEGNFGSACTCAITEFMSNFPEQTKKFAAKVVFLDATQRRKLLNAHLREYAHFHFEKDPDWTFDEKKEYRAQAQTAEGTFLDLFRGKPSFNNRTELKSYIRTAHENDSGEMISTQMEAWCNELIAAHASSQLVFIEADRAIRLRGALNPFLSSSNSSSREPCLWPLVFKVSIGIRGTRILQNLILADMPGLSDISRVRVKASKSYILSSDHLWIVAPIARCVSDTVVDSVLCEFGERFKGCLAIVGTKVDDPMTSTLFKHRYRKAAKRLDKIEKSLAEAEANGCQEEVERLTNVRLRFMVRTRNHEIAKDIYESKSEYFEKSEYGPVFFVSNERYMWLKGYKESGIKEAATQFSAELTGIPALREYALSIPVQEMWLTFMTYIQHTIVTFMKSLAIWAARTSADQGKKLRSIKERSMKASSNSSWVAVQRDAVLSLAVTMRNNLDEVAQKGYDYLHGTVRGWSWMTIRAVIAREGTFNSNAAGVGLVQWNEKLKQPTARHLMPEWDRLFLNERSCMAATEKKTTANLDALYHYLEEMMQLYNIPMEQFGDLIEAQKHGITRAVQISSDNLDKELKNTKLLTENDMRFGYFAQMMRPTYREASQIRGTGYKHKVVTMFEDLINQRTKDSPFVRMADYAANKVGHHAKIFSEDLHKTCNNIYDEVFNQFGGLMIESEDDNKDVEAVKTALGDYLPSVDAEMIDIINKLKAIEKNPNIGTTALSNRKVKKEEKQQDRKPEVKTEVKHEQL
ncbi:hypothetical protein KCU95_g8610, partial [Aureobasidium melanogenum]